MPGAVERHAPPETASGNSSPVSRSFSSRLPLSRSEIDRDHLGRAGGVEALLSDPATRAVALHDGKALLAGPAALAVLPAASIPHVDALYLGRAISDTPDLPAGSPVVALLLDDAQAAALTLGRGGRPEGDEGRHWGDLRRLGHRLGERDAGLFTQALALANWHIAYGFSPRTGEATRIGAAGWTRVDADGRELFPRTDAAVIVGITDSDDRLLLGSNALWETNRFSLLAGFVEPGESLEAAVIREVHEESGLRVADPVYLGSQPWPFPASLMVGFRAHVPEGESTVATPDGDEILELRWFTRDELRDAAAAREIILPGPTSIARAIVEDWYGDEVDDGSRADDRSRT
jgi:NAD+ diphosphatase